MGLLLLIKRPGPPPPGVAGFRGRAAPGHAEPEGTRAASCRPLPTPGAPQRQTRPLPLPLALFRPAAASMPPPGGGRGPLRPGRPGGFAAPGRSARPSLAALATVRARSRDRAGAEADRRRLSLHPAGAVCAPAKPRNPASPSVRLPTKTAPPGAPPGRNESGVIVPALIRPAPSLARLGSLRNAPALREIANASHGRHGARPLGPPGAGPLRRLPRSARGCSRAEPPPPRFARPTPPPPSIPPGPTPRPCTLTVPPDCR